MIYYRCKCGKSEAYGSMGPRSCERCSKCGSNLAPGPDAHRDPVPHQIIRSKVDSDEGEAFIVECIACHAKKTDIERRGEPWAWWGGSEKEATR